MGPTKILLVVVLLCIIYYMLKSKLQFVDLEKHLLHAENIFVMEVLRYNDLIYSYELQISWSNI